MTERTPGHDSASGARSAAATADPPPGQAHHTITQPAVDGSGGGVHLRSPNGAAGRAPVAADATGWSADSASADHREAADGRTAEVPTEAPSRPGLSIDPAAVEAGIVALWRSYGDNPMPVNRDRLVLHYAPLVKYVAGRVGTGLPTHVDHADLVQSGILGLVDAIERFEPDRGPKFETYAMQRIRGAILDDLRAQDWVPRSVRSRSRDVERAMERLEAKLHRSASDAEIAEELEVTVEELRDLFAQLRLTSVAALDELVAVGRGAGSLAETLQDHYAEDPVAALEDRENRRLLAEAIAQLRERDRTVVTLYYFENLTLAEIGKVLGVTESRVCQLHTRAVLLLRTKLNDAATG